MKLQRPKKACIRTTAKDFGLGQDGEGLVRPTLKEQVLQTLEQFKNTHYIKIDEEEQIADRNTYHLIARTKKSALRRYGNLG